MVVSVDSLEGELITFSESLTTPRGSEYAHGVAIRTYARIL